METFAGALSVKTDGLNHATFRVAGHGGSWGVAPAISPRSGAVLGFRVIRVKADGDLVAVASTSTFLEAWRIAAGEASLAFVTD